VPIGYQHALNAGDWAQDRRRNLDFDPAGASRIKPMSYKPSLNAWTHPVNDRQKTLRDEIELRGQHVMRAAFEHETRRATCENKWHEDGLEDESGATGSADREVKLPGSNSARANVASDDPTISPSHSSRQNWRLGVVRASSFDARAIPATCLTQYFAWRKFLRRKSFIV
jgi:hypothetical protein